ncbi:MAG TPA: cytochrome c [Woeseiaceae bacterium]|nr:cytochrome c [Woeseiaceae bacterium]
MKHVALFLVLLPAFAAGPAGSADEDTRERRHELMEDKVGAAAKPVGNMLRGEAAFDADVLMASLRTFHEVSGEFGKLFPPGSEGGPDSRAAPAIWEDRAGFDAALAEWRDAVEAALAAEPDSLDVARPAVGPVFNACKNCHDNYRLEDD